MDGRPLISATGPIATALMLALHGMVHAASPAPFTTEVERCILPAAEFHRVNHLVLRAILKLESGLNPAAVARNGNGTIDVGIGQLNSIHFRSLAQFGIAPDHLKDACIGTYVSAWHLAKTIARHGNTWFGVASYHSTTPYFNRRYQILLNNELVRSGSMPGTVLPVPALRPSSESSSAVRSPRDALIQGTADPPTMVVMDQ